MDISTALQVPQKVALAGLHLKIPRGKCQEAMLRGRHKLPCHDFGHKPTISMVWEHSDVQMLCCYHVNCQGLASLQLTKKQMMLTIIERHYLCEYHPCESAESLLELLSNALQPV